MGFSLTGSHVIFFIASVIVASTVSGIFIAVTQDVSNSLSERGDRVQEQLDTDFEIINDPDNIPTAGGGADYVFYVKNIGGGKLITTNTEFQLFVDGDFVPTTNYNFSVSSVQPGEVSTLYVDNSELAAGTRTIRLVGPMAIDDELTCTIV